MIESLDVLGIVEKKTLDKTIVDKFSPYWPKERFPGFFDLSTEACPFLFDEESNRLVIPSYDWNDELRGIKYRSLKGKKVYVSEPGSETGYYYLHSRQKWAENAVLITEGEIDAVTARLLGFQGAILALQTSHLNEDARAFISQSFSEIFLALDNDEAGLEAEKSIKLDFPSAKSFTFPLEVKDFNELLCVKGRKFGEQEVASQLKLSIQSLVNQPKELMPEMYEFLANRRNLTGVSTGFAMIDSQIGGGLRPGEVSVIHAKYKIGKSTFLNQLYYNLMIQGYKVGLASFEMGAASELLPSLVSIHTQYNLRAITNPDEIESLSSRPDVTDVLSRIYFFKGRKGRDLYKIRAWVDYVVSLGAEFIAFDHSLFMIKKPNDSNEHLELYEFMADLAVEKNIHIIIVVQAPKTKDGEMLGPETCYGGASVSMYPKNFFTLTREKVPEAPLKVMVDFCRYPGANLSFEHVHLFYNRQTCTLSEQG